MVPVIWPEFTMLTEHKCPYCGSRFPDFFVEEVRGIMVEAFEDESKPGSAFTWDCPMCYKNFAMCFSNPHDFIVLTKEAYDLVLERHKKQKVSEN